jgi:hypothetical protein
MDSSNLVLWATYIAPKQSLDIVKELCATFVELHSKNELKTNQILSVMDPLDDII